MVAMRNAKKQRKDHCDLPRSPCFGVQQDRRHAGPKHKFFTHGGNEHGPNIGPVGQVQDHGGNDAARRWAPVAGRGGRGGAIAIAVFQIVLVGELLMLLVDV